MNPETPAMTQHPRHQHKSLVAMAVNTLRKPPVVLILLALSFFLGYISHSDPSISPSDPSISNIDLSEHTRFLSQCGGPVSSKAVRQTILDKVFDGKSPWDSFPPSHVKALLLPEWTKGWGSHNKVFEHLIRKVRPKTIIEVGTFLGASATHMASLTRKLGLDCQIICVDDFRGWPGYRDGNKDMKLINGDVLLLYQFMQNVVSRKGTDSIIFMPFSSGTALGGLCKWGIYGDLVEVDAAHNFHSAWLDINWGYKVLKPGGVLFGHDYFLPEDNYGVRRAVRLFARLHGFKVLIDGEHWILEPIQ